MTKKTYISLVSLVVLPVLSFADTVITSDGATLIGKIKAISEKTISMETAYAGTIEINREKIVNFTTDEAVHVRFDSGNLASGIVSKEDPGKISVGAAEGEVVVGIPAIKEAWLPSDKDPEIVRFETEEEKNRRKWKTELSADLSKKTGNTDRESVGAYLDIKLEGPHDLLNFYGHYIYGKENGNKTDDETVGGISYSNYFTEHLGWYVRTELERDPFEAIDLRSTSGAGLSWRIINQELHKTVFDLGVSYRYETYTTNADNEGNVGLDLRLGDDWTITSWLREVTTIRYIPAFDDFNDYLLKQDTALEMPLGLSDVWRLRIGMSNDYNNRPKSGRDHLDTTYYARILLRF